MDDTQLLFNSNWDIDQIEPRVDIAVSTGDTVIKSGLTQSSVHEVQFKPTGGLGWNSSGRNLASGALGTAFDFYSYLVGTTIHVVTPSAGNVRLYLWDDKMDY